MDNLPGWPKDGSTKVEEVELLGETKPPTTKKVNKVHGQQRVKFWKPLPLAVVVELEPALRKVGPRKA